MNYSDKESIKSALAGIDVVISTISSVALGVQIGIAEAAKEAGVKLFIPSEFGGPTEGATEGLFGAKARVQDQLKSAGIPYALFYTGPHADSLWGPYATCIARLAFDLPLWLQVRGPRLEKWESIRGWRWQSADFVHFKT